MKQKFDIIDKYERIIKSQQKVLFLKGPQGTGKTAIPKYIAEKNGWQYIDFRASNRDAAEIIGIPQKFAKLKNGEITIVDNNNDFKHEEVSSYFCRYLPPEWAVLANERPTLVSFEEINRASLEVRNALLQILLEKGIGESFQLNKDVYFVATGNLGSIVEDDREIGDGCEVEELDGAHKGRFFIENHEMSVSTWKDRYGDEFVNPFIVNFLTAFPEHCFKLHENCEAESSFRSWTFLSNFIGKDEKDIDVILRDVEEYGKGYVGLSFLPFVNYLKNMKRLNVKDILDNYQTVKPIINSVPRDQINEVVENLKKVSYKNISKKKTQNIKEFLNDIPDDLRVAFHKFVYEELVSINEDKLSNLNVDKEEDILENIEFSYSKKEEEFVNDLIETYRDEYEYLLKIESGEIEEEPSNKEEDSKKEENSDK